MSWMELSRKPVIFRLLSYTLITFAISKPPLNSISYSAKHGHDDFPAKKTGELPEQFATQKASTSAIEVPHVGTWKGRGSPFPL